MDSDFKNYLKRLRYPKFAFFSLLYFTRAIYRKVKRSISFIDNLKEFKSIKKYQLKILNDLDVRIDIKSPKFTKQFKLKIVSGIKEIKNSDDWHIRFIDAEMNVSIDRWSWLLLGQENKLFPFSYEDGLFLIRSWSSQFINDEILAKKEPYSIGERISNGILFFKLNKYIIPNDILLIFKKLTSQLVKNLEYYPNGLTGNHAFNNARALYLISNIIPNDNIKLLALEIVDERLNSLVSDDGFMREGSSNYQFIFTRWVLEMIWNAQELKDYKTLNILLPFAEKLLKQCWFFLIQNKINKKWNYPLFGDVSPDCPPEWLISLTWSKIAINIYQPKNIPLAPKNIGWAKLFGGITNKNSSKNKLKINFSSVCGWHRIEFFDWTIFTYTPLKETQLRATHSHLDLCSFVLYLKGKPIIIDIGRYDYTNSDLSKHCKSAKAHNSLIINDIGPETELFSWTNPAYSEIKTKLSIKKSDSKIFIKIDHNGYKRVVAQKVNHQRTIILNKKNVSVKDIIKGNGNVTVNNFFNFAPGLNLLEIDNKILKLSDKLNFKTNSNSIKTNKFNKKTSGWLFPSYGVKVPILHLEIKTEKSLPVTIINKITLNK